MPYPEFLQFADALCMCAGVATPSLHPDPSGMLAFHLVLDDVVVNVLQMPATDTPDDDVFVLVTFGAIPAEMMLEALQAIAEANYVMLGTGAPVFGMNPETEQVVLRQQMSLSLVEAKDAFALIERLVQAARQWRLDPTLAPGGATGVVVDLHRLA